MENDAVNVWKYEVGDFVEGGMEMQYDIQDRMISIANGQRFYLVGSIEGQKTMCAHDFEQATAKISRI
jgi:hypothetical protein